MQWNTTQHNTAESQKHYAVKDAMLKRLQTVLFLLYESLEKTQLIHGGSLEDEVGVGLTGKGHEGNLWGDSNVLYFDRGLG